MALNCKKFNLISMAPNSPFQWHQIFCSNYKLNLMVIKPNFKSNQNTK